MTFLSLLAARKQVNTYAAEADELRNEVADLRAEVEQLHERLKSRQAGSRSGRQDDDEGVGDAETVIGETQAAGDSSRQHMIDQERLERVQEEAATLRAAVRESEKARRAQLTEAGEAQRKAVRDVEERCRAEVHRAEARAAQAERELAFEVEQSKKHLQERRAAAASQGTISTAYNTQGEATQIAALSIASGTSVNAVQARLQKLQEDLTGLQLVSAKVDDPPSATTYSFLLSDFKRRKTLSFKLMISGESGDAATGAGGNAKYDFVPDIQPGRDDAVMACLDKTLQGHIQFGAPQLHHFFRRLYKSMNSLQISQEE